MLRLPTRNTTLGIGSDYTQKSEYPNLECLENFTEQRIPLAQLGECRFGHASLDLSTVIDGCLDNEIQPYTGLNDGNWSLDGVLQGTGTEPGQKGICNA
ncbi:TPA: hypothetical protein ACKP0L_003215, partial [Pseudomonas putida]